MNAGIAAMVLSSLLFSAMSALIALSTGVSSFLTTLARFVVGTTVVGTLGMTGRIKLEFNNTRLLVLRGILGGVGVYVSYLAITRLGMARGSTVSYTYPLFATVGGAIFLGERIRPRAALAVVLALAGLALLRLGDWLQESAWSPWFLAAVGGALLMGMAVVTVRKLTQTDSAPVIYLSQSLVGLCIVFVPALGSPSTLSLRVALILLGVGATATVAQLLMTWSYRTVDVATGSLLSMLTPVVNVVLGVTLFRETLGTLQTAGSLLILLACALVVLPTRRAHAPTAPAGLAP